MTDITLAQVDELDRNDPLAYLRDRFDLPDGLIYLDGNSLGPRPKGVREQVLRLLDVEWRDDLIQSWNSHDWISLPQKVGGRIAQLIGAAPDEVLACDSTSVNLFKLLSAAVALRPERKVIVTPNNNFPTDIYIAEGLVRQLGGDYRLRFVEHDDPLAGLDDDVAVLSLTHIDYRSGRMLDMAQVTRAAHDAGALMLWDLAHSAGAMPVDLNGAEADFAVGCGYKYLNGGPGAPAFLFVAGHLQDQIRQPLSGWMGHQAPFAFEGNYRPADGIHRNATGTPPVLSMVALAAALAAYDGVDMAQVRQKSLALGDLFIDLMAQECGDFGFELATPRDVALRGSQVSFRHGNGYPIMQALIDAQVIGDFRAPDILRFGLTPLYLRYREIWQAVGCLKGIMATGAWDRPEFHARAAVT